MFAPKHVNRKKPAEVEPSHKFILRCVCTVRPQQGYSDQLRTLYFHTVRSTVRSTQHGNCSVVAAAAVVIAIMLSSLLSVQSQHHCV